MATEQFIIVIQERGARTVNRNIRGIGNTSKQTEGAVSRLKAALVGLGGALAVRQIVDYADAFRTIQNRLRFVTETTESVGAATEALFEVSNRTRSSFEGTAEVYARLAFAGKGLGRSQAELISITETLNKATLLSGVRTQEAKNALIQLSQGIASNTLRGDELRAVLEQLPVVADLIAKSMGITRGELRKLGAEGKITAEQVVIALEASKGEIDEAFKGVIPTIGQALEVLRNNVIKFIGDFDNARGVSNKAAAALIFVARHIKDFARVLGALLIVLGAVAGFKGIAGVIRALQALAVAAATNPVSALGIALVSVIALLTTFSDKIRIAKVDLRELGFQGEELRLALEEMPDSAITFADFANSAIQEAKKVAVEASATARSAITDLLNTARDSADTYDFSAKTLLLVFARTIDQFTGLINATFKATRQFVLSHVHAAIEGINLLISASNKLRSKVGLSEIPKIGLDIEFKDPAEIVTEYVSDLKGIFSSETTGAFENFIVNALEGAGDFTLERLRRELQAIKDRLKGEADLAKAGDPTLTAGDSGANKKTFRDILDGLAQENILLRLNNDERAVTEEIFRAQKELKRDLNEDEIAILGELVRQNLELERQNQLYDEIVGPKAELLERQARLNALVEAGGENLELYKAALNDVNVQLTALDNTLGGGIENALARIGQQADTAGQQLSDILVGAFDDATRAIVDFAATGDLKIREFLSNLSQQLLEFATKQLLIRAFSSLPGFQQGGSFKVGGQGGPDSQLVAFRASPGETVTVGTPGQDAPAQAAAPAAPPNVTVVNVQDPAEIQAAMSAPEGEQVILNVLNRNRQALRSLVAG